MDIVFRIEELSAGTATVTVNVNDTSMVGRVTGGGDYENDEEITIEAIFNPWYRFHRRGRPKLQGAGDVANIWSM